MFAVIQNGGKQYKVQEGSKVVLEKIELDAGAEFDTKDVLVLNDGKETFVGTPFVVGAVVKMVVLEQKRNKKVIIFKKRRRKNSRRKTGHRQRVTLVQVKSISR